MTDMTDNPLRALVDEFERRSKLAPTVAVQIAYQQAAYDLKAALAAPAQDAVAHRWIREGEPVGGWIDGMPSERSIAAAKECEHLATWTLQYAYTNPPHQSGNADAWLHTVVQDDGEQDQALSFSPDSFPLEGVGGFKSIASEPLYRATPPTPSGNAALVAKLQKVSSAMFKDDEAVMWWIHDIDEVAAALAGGRQESQWVTDLRAEAMRAAMKDVFWLSRDQVFELIGDASGTRRALAGQAQDSGLPKPQSRKGKEPCGECHIQPGETCDICEATQPQAQEAGRDGVCTWHQQDYYGTLYSSGCGHEYMVNDCTDGNVPIPFCPFCAKTLESKAWSDDDDDQQESNDAQQR